MTQADQNDPAPIDNRGGARRGAGRKPAENPRSIPYQLRLSQDERDKLERVATAAKMTPADWLRDRIAKAKDPTP